MKTFTAVAALGLFAAVNAQSSCLGLAELIPTCAQQCLAKGAAAAGCGLTDLSCQCKNTDAIDAAAAGCVEKSCGEQELPAVAASAKAVCECVATAEPASPTAAVGAESAAAEATSTTAAEAAGMTAEAVMGSGSAAPYPTPIQQITDGQIQASSAPSASGAAAASAGMSGSGSSPESFMGAGNKIAVSFGGIVLAIGAGMILL